MDKQERLREEYEDALFAIMMDGLASSLGQEALEENERLNSDPAAAVPERIDKRCMRTIRGHYRRAAAKRIGRTTLKAAGRLAMVCGIAGILFLGAFAASERVRTNTMNLIVETFGESTDFYFVPPPGDNVPQVKAGWVPDGFALNEEGSDEMNSWFLYTGMGTQYIQGRYFLGDGQVLGIDTEDAGVAYIQLRDTEATLVSKDGRFQMAWGTADKAGFVYILAEGVTEEELIQVAENIRYGN